MKQCLFHIVALVALLYVHESVAQTQTSSSPALPEFCFVPSYGMPPLRVVQDALRGQYDRSRRSIASARVEARRSARLPEYVRVQTGARMDSDRENRRRLAQDFDGFGVPSKSALEDRSTNQQDFYVDVRASAEWRLSRLRWSDAETALRREDAQASDRLRDDLRSLHEWWLDLLKLGRIICKEDSIEPALPQRGSTRSPATPTSQEEAIQRFISLAERIDFLTEGFLVEHWPAYRTGRLRSDPEVTNTLPSEIFSAPDLSFVPDSD